MAAKQIVILGGGVGGTLLANLLSRRLKPDQAKVTVVDEYGQHLYQPGWLYLPFGEESTKNLVKTERSLLSRAVQLVIERADGIDVKAQTVALTSGTKLPYDYLIIATGASLVPNSVPGFAEGASHFYSEPEALKLKKRLEQFEGGELVIGVADIPYKCPPAPLEFTFKVEEYLTKRGLRDKTHITYLSPINRVFTIESVSEFVTPMFEERHIDSELFFNTESVDPGAHKVVAMEGTEISYDLLVLIPPHRGAKVIQDSGLGDELGWLPTDRHTLQVKGYENIFGLGDATDVPVSKSGSAAHFEAKALAHRIVHAIRPNEDHASEAEYDGRVMCFLETGHGQSSQLVFDFEHPPKPPAPNAFYHYEKMIFNRAYWYIVPRGIV